MQIRQGADAIFVDGGITQMRAAKNAIKACEVEIPIYGMVKNDKHRTKALIDENRNDFERCLYEKLRSDVVRGN